MNSSDSKSKFPDRNRPWIYPREFVSLNFPLTDVCHKVRHLSVSLYTKLNDRLSHNLEWTLSLCFHGNIAWQHFCDLQFWFYCKLYIYFVPYNRGNTLCNLTHTFFFIINNNLQTWITTWYHVNSNFPTHPFILSPDRCFVQYTCVRVVDEEGLRCRVWRRERLYSRQKT